MKIDRRITRWVPQAASEILRRELRSQAVQSEEARLVVEIIVRAAADSWGMLGETASSDMAAMRDIREARRFIRRRTIEDSLDWAATLAGLDPDWTRARIANYVRGAARNSDDARYRRLAAEALEYWGET